MKMTRRFLLVSVASVLLGVNAHAKRLGRTAVHSASNPAANADTATFKCSGTVADAAGHLLSGVKVEYWRNDNMRVLGDNLVLVSRATTKAGGAFEFLAPLGPGYLLAQKNGLAMAWADLNRLPGSGSSLEEKLVLTPPSALAGVVVDENGKPVARARVSVALAVGETSRESGQTFNHLGGKLARDHFTVRTDAAGHFRIKNFPTNATALLAIRSPGKVLRPLERNLTGPNLPWRAGQEDIKLVVEPSGSIEGKIVVEGSNQPPPRARLILQPQGPRGGIIGGQEPSQSGSDGTFRINDVAAGDYQIQATFGTAAVPNWVASNVPVLVESGRATRGVHVTATRGGCLEVTMVQEGNHKPQAHATVNVYEREFQSAAQSDSNGIALLRLPPGTYNVTGSGGAGAGNARDSVPAGVESGKTNRVEIELVAPKIISGIVRQPDGQPAAGLRVDLVGGYGPEMGNVKTDGGGRFKLEWNPGQMGPNQTGACVLVRDVDRNLAAAEDIDEDTGPLDLKLAPGLTLAVRAESNGKPLTNATAALIFWSGRSGQHVPGWSRGTKTPGWFEITALPPGRKYGVNVSAPGYGKRMINNVAVTDEPGRVELAPFELNPANLKLAGQVLDANDKPVADVFVNLNGDGQPDGNTKTDRGG
jgi:protocatechuate 3,4-dioxygenase beta subunit